MIAVSIIEYNLAENERLGVADVIGDKRVDVLRLAAQHGAHNVRVFGSVARGEAGPHSDVDFLVEMASNCSLMDLSGLVIDLQELLGRPVDVAEAPGLHHLIHDRVLREALPL